MVENRWQFWIDRGGTFTDVVGRRPDGQLVTTKLLSENPGHYPDAASEGVRRLLGLAPGEPVPADLVEAVKMGTTVATNALLERTGEPTVLLITEGFADALRIGYQNRPHLFALDIVLPDLLYDEVVEVGERVAADGTVLVPLDEERARADLVAARGRGYASVAIVCVHGYRYPAHERRLAELAARAGFSQISTSHDTSPLIRLVGRGDTTVVDAYLSPLLRRYVEVVHERLGRARLLFMQSHGGLADADGFRGKDAILSGPAGGVVGMARAALAAGFDRLIGFDMGGTSTDVAHVAAAGPAPSGAPSAGGPAGSPHGGGTRVDFERSFETVVAGVRLRAPMLRIHTVAAGGGSILHFDGSRFRVGPDSAGADPGPHCYRRGGPWP